MKTAYTNRILSLFTVDPPCPRCYSTRAAMLDQLTSGAPTAWAAIEYVPNGSKKRLTRWRQAIHASAEV